MRLDRRRVLITGRGSGIGLEIRQLETPAEGRTGRLVGAHFRDVAVSTSSTAPTIPASTDGEPATADAFAVGLNS